MIKCEENTRVQRWRFFQMFFSKKYYLSLVFLCENIIELGVVRRFLANNSLITIF